jgi:predicted XRE-type DNA-binding protein
MKVKIKESSDNVFQDIGLPDSEGYLAKAEIAIQICAIIKKKKLSQTKVAKLLKIAQSKVSLLLRGRLDGFSLEKLLSFLIALGQNVDISVKPSGRETGRDCKA